MAGDCWATAPELIKGKLEIRGIGIVEMEYVPEAPLALVVELTSDISACRRR